MSKKKQFTNYEKFEIVKVSRTAIKEAKYNPRIISSEAQKKLKNNLKKVGLLQPLVVNKRTGNLVSGHQRLKVLDELNKELDYELTVAYVDLSEKEEKEQNIFFNNINAMGEWHLPALAEMLPGLEIEETGFSLSGLAGLDISLESLQAIPEEEAMIPDFSAKRPSMTKEEVIAEKQRVKEISNSNNNTHFYFTIVFNDADSLDEFMSEHGFDNKYCSPDEFLEKFV